MDKKFFMFERSEFEKFPISSAFYSTQGRQSFGSFLLPEKNEKEHKNFLVLFVGTKSTKKTFLKPYFLHKKWRWGESHPRPNIFSSRALQV